MIVKLIPEQIVSLWDSIRYGIINAIAPLVEPTPSNIRDILCKLLRHDMQCWCVFDKDKNIYAYITTSISIDMHTKSRALIIYSLFAHKKASSEMWSNGIKALEEFAKKNKCTRITAYTNNADILSIATKYEFNTDYTYIVKDL